MASDRVEIIRNEGNSGKISPKTPNNFFSRLIN